MHATWFYGDSLACWHEFEYNTANGTQTCKHCGLSGTYCNDDLTTLGTTYSEVIISYISYCYTNSVCATCSKQLYSTQGSHSFGMKHYSNTCDYTQTCLMCGKVKSGTDHDKNYTGYSTYTDNLHKHNWTCNDCGDTGYDAEYHEKDSYYTFRNNCYHYQVTYCKECDYRVEGEEVECDNVVELFDEITSTTHHYWYGCLTCGNGYFQTTDEHTFTTTSISKTASSTHHLLYQECICGYETTVEEAHDGQPCTICGWSAKNPTMDDVTGLGTLKPPVTDENEMCLSGHAHEAEELSEHCSDCSQALGVYVIGSNTCLCSESMLSCKHKQSQDVFENVNNEAEDACLELEKVTLKNEEEDETKET